MQPETESSRDRLMPGLQPLTLARVVDGIDTPPDHGPLSYERPDVLILDDVVRLLAWDPIVPSTTLELECNAGTVRVGGTVPDPGLIERIELLVSSVIGVTEIEVSVSADESWQPVPGESM